MQVHRRGASPPIARIISLCSARSAKQEPLEGVVLTRSAGPFPVVVVDGAGARSARTAELLGAGWTLGEPPAGVQVITVVERLDAALAVRHVLTGAGALIDVAGAEDADTVDDLLEDLARIATVLSSDDRDVLALDVDTWRLLHATATGRTLVAASELLHLSLRTANRRLGEAKIAVGASSRAGLLALLSGPNRVRAQPEVSR